MGILTSALNEIIQQGINFGFRQIDDVFTTLKQQGRDAEAMQYLMSQDEPFTSKMLNPQQNIGMTQMPGGVLPTGTDLGNYNLPEVTQSHPMSIWSTDAAKSFSKASPWIQQLATQRGIQDITHDPRYAAQELAQKQQEAIISASQSAAGTLGGKGNIGNYDIGPYIMGTQQYSPQNIWGNAAQGAATVEAAKFPEWQKRHDISVADQIRVKQTPGARAMGSGDGGGSAANTIGPSFQNTVVNNLMKRYPALFRQQAKDERGQPAVNLSTGLDVYEPSPAALQVAQEIADEYARTKTPNYMKIETQAVQRFKKAQTDETSQMPPKPTALQNLPRPQPTTEPKTTPLPTALGNLPKPQPTQSPQPTPPTVTAAQMINAISAAKAEGKSSAFIRKMIQSRGFDPENFGY